MANLSASTDSRDRLKQEVHGLREALAIVLRELEQRRDELVDRRRQHRAHDLGVSLASGGLVALLLGLLRWHRGRRPRHRLRSIARYALRELRRR
jgi:hypothetical protein